MRTLRADIEDQAIQTVADAISELGLEVAGSPDGHSPDSPGDQSVVIKGSGDSGEVSLQIHGITVATPERVAALLRNRRRPHRKGQVDLLVADALPETSRKLLEARGWAWIDRRGEMDLRAPGVFIRATIRPQPRDSAPRPTQPIRGIAGISWALALLMNPQNPPGVRATARDANLSPSTISTAKQQLQEAALTRDDNTPVIPDLFWALADAWSPHRVALASLPDPEMFAPQELAVTSDVAASLHDAPVPILADQPPDLYVSSQADLRRLQARFGNESNWSDRACSAAVAPTPLALHTATAHQGTFGVVHAVVAALDLAKDRVRGAEILQNWHPNDFDRVW